MISGPTSHDKELLASFESVTLILRGETRKKTKIYTGNPGTALKQRPVVRGVNSFHAMSIWLFTV